jgi:RNA polymerase sigma-70 factor (ECF subfamily)
MGNPKSQIPNPKIQNPFFPAALRPSGARATGRPPPVGRSLQPIPSNAVVEPSKLSEIRSGDDYLHMEGDGHGVAVTTPMTDGARESGDEDAMYIRAAAEFGPALFRLATAYESDHFRQQDLLQELHFALWRSLAVFRNQCSLRTWVYRIAHNTAITFIRQERRTNRLRPISLEDLDDFAGKTDVDRMVHDEDLRQKIRTLIRQLKPIDQNILLLYLEGLKASEIGDVVGLSPANVAQKIHRAQKYLKRHFQSGVRP